MCLLSCMQLPCLICTDYYTTGERVDSINHYAGEIRRLETAILTKKAKILEVSLLLSASFPDRAIPWLSIAMSLCSLILHCFPCRQGKASTRMTSGH